MKINSLKKQKHEYLIHMLSNKAFNSTVVNRALSAWHEEPLEISLTVSLSRRFVD